MSGVHDIPDRTAGDPVCPTCDAVEHVTLNTGKAGGLLCERCLTVFSAKPGEHAANADRRALWREVTRRRSA